MLARLSTLKHLNSRIVLQQAQRFPFSVCPVPAPDTIYPSDPNALKQVEFDLRNVFPNIKRLLNPPQHMKAQLFYYFGGEGKCLRPHMMHLLARALISHTGVDPEPLQNGIGVIATASEMIHTAGLMYDDVVDSEILRRGKPSINNVFGQRQSISAGNYTLMCAIRALNRLGYDSIVSNICRILNDVVDGEFMQTWTELDQRLWFPQYIERSEKKTASMLAHFCLSVATVCGVDKSLQNAVFEFGRDFGIAFQIVDDILDFVHPTQQDGQEVVEDISQGLATAPVLFAAEQFPELVSIISRKFERPGDVETVLRLTSNSEGVNRSRELAAEYCSRSFLHLSHISDSVYKVALIDLLLSVLNRNRG